MIGASRLRARRVIVLAWFPAIFAAIAAAASILAAAAAAAPLFLSSTGTASVRSALEPHVADALTLSKGGALPADVVRLRDEQVRAALAASADVGSPTETLVGSPLKLSSPAGRTTVRVAFRTSFTANVERTSGASSGRGVWLPDRLARAVRVSSGDDVTLTREGRSLSVPVVATYSASSRDPYWADLASTVGGKGEPAGLALADPAIFLRISTGLEDSGEQRWVFPVSRDAAAHATLERAAGMARDISNVMRAAADTRTQLGSVLEQPIVRSPVTSALRAAERAEGSIVAPIRTLSLTGELAALFGVLAAGVYAVRRRRIEMRSLDAKGITPARLVMRCAAEGSVPVAAGACAGWLVTWGAIRSFGPASLVEAHAVRASLVDAAVAGMVAVAVLSLAMTTAARTQARETARGAPSVAARSLLWEVPVLVLGAAALYEIDTRGAGAVSGAGPDVHLDRLLLLFPVLFIAGSAGLAVRGLARLLVRFRGSESWPLPLYLASRRLALAPRVAVVLVTACTLAIGVLAYAATIVATVRTSAENKIVLATGADVTASTAGPISPPPPGSGITTTNVMRLSYVNLGSAGGRVDVLGVDPETFASTSRWDPSLSDRSLDELMAALRPVSEPLPAVLVAAAAPAGGAGLVLGGVDLPLRVVGSARAFPGATSHPTVVVSTSALGSVLERHDARVALDVARYEAWAAGPTDRASAYLVSSGADPLSIRVAAERLRTPGFRALASSFVFMQMMGFVTAVVAVVGLLLYLQARQRARTLSYAVARRMGLSGSAHGLAVLAEVAGLLACAYVLGSALGVTTSFLVFRRVDPLPMLRPAPVLLPPYGLLAAIGVAIAAGAALAAWAVHHRAAHADVAAVIRFAE